MVYLIPRNQPPTQLEPCGLGREAASEPESKLENIARQARLHELTFLWLNVVLVHDGYMPVLAGYRGMLTLASAPAPHM